MESFRYEPERCSFKGWLMHVTRGHIRDRLRRRRTHARWFEPLPLETDGAAEAIPDEAAERAFEAMRAEEWREHVLNSAANRVKPGIGLRHYEIYVLRCVKGLPVPEVCKQLNVSAPTVYLVAHRVACRFKREVQQLQKRLQ
jgi:RNA polymerase sigma factor (sigma-70 family)